MTSLNTVTSLDEEVRGIFISGKFTEIGRCRFYAGVAHHRERRGPPMRVVETDEPPEEPKYYYS